ncbi:hypothetical protein [Lentzea nigeriaca]|uniref:hypothetical protein n=1 Tax=Lentzea nigeriaca TaxID=1128665 RepID=UPI00195D6855|nr:hypothetical protein [Lentzea nigeriaca]MBM7857508.1 hypothetical protein [Lentzea nigeriaca]
MITPARYSDGAIHAPGDVTFPVAAKPRDQAVAPDLTRAVYTTDNELVCVDRIGVVRWRHAFGVFRTKVRIVRAGCVFSLDGKTVWLFQPDATGHWNDGSDTWHVLDAATGVVLASADLGTAGQGNQHVHPGGTDVLVDVGEGQDGSFLFRGRLNNNTLEVVPYPWENRVLVAFATDGHHFMTVHHEQHDVAFHTYPDGEVVMRVTVTDLGYDENARLEWTGGYLDADTAFVVAGVEGDDEEWFRHHLIDVRTGAHLGPFDAHTDDAYGVIPAGGGAWLTFDDGVFRLHVR